MNEEIIRNDMLLYIKLSKEVIDESLDRRDYRQALGRLLIALNRLSGDDKQEMVKYYMDNLRRLNILQI